MFDYTYTILLFYGYVNQFDTGKITKNKLRAHLFRHDLYLINPQE